MLPDQPYQDVLAYAATLVRNLDPASVAQVHGAAVGCLSMGSVVVEPAMFGPGTSSGDSCGDTQV
jgi:hypothetical protein